MKRVLRITILTLAISTSVLTGGMAVYANQKTVSSELFSDSWSVGQDSLISSSTERTVSEVQNRTQDPGETTARASRSFFSSWFLQPFRSVSQQENEKLIANVKVLPSPAVETINLSFSLGKRSEVSVKVMDALGNEMLNLLNQTMDAGNQNQSFEIQGKLSSGMYFLRVTAGTETVIKRISVL